MSSRPISGPASAGCDVSTPAAAAHSASLFQTGWFLESLLTQTLIIHVMRTNRVPFLQSRASWQGLVVTILCYMALTQLAETWLLWSAGADAAPVSNTSTMPGRPRPTAPRAAKAACLSARAAPR